MTGPHFDPLDSTRVMELLEKNSFDVDAVPTPFPLWNECCREEGGREGMALGWYVVLGGATGKGKTAVVLNMLAEAVKHGHQVGMVNFEMSQKQLASRYLAIATGQDKRYHEPGKDFDEEKARSAAAELDQLDGLLYTNRDPIVYMEDLRASVDALAQAGCKMIAVDYLQLIHVEGISNDYEQTKVISNTLRTLVHQYGTFVCVALSQLNTEAGKSHAAPTEYNLHGGGKWSYDADQVVLINHQKHETDQDNPFAGYGELILQKNRHGPSEVSFGIRWDWKTMRVAEMYRPPEQDVPKYPDKSENTMPWEV